MLIRCVAICQIIALVRIVSRLVRSANGMRIQTVSGLEKTSVSIVVPVLNEETRIRACLDALRPVRTSVDTIIVTDGGSTDRTRSIVTNDYGDVAVLVDASPIPPGDNGKAWGLHIAEASASESDWTLVIDADVSVEPQLVTSLVHHANHHGLDLVSVAARQRVDTFGLSLLHPAMLASLVLRYGIPGSIVSSPDSVQANGQCMLVSNRALNAVGGFASVADSIVEDVSLGRRVAAIGGRVGIFEWAGSDAMVTTTMYSTALDAWTGWSRSLPMRDRNSGWGWRLRIWDLVAVQGLWLPMVCATRLQGLAGKVALLAMVVRIGTGFGLLRAYTSIRWPMVCAPLLDVPVVIQLLRQSVRRTHYWRGRPVTSRYGEHR